jgi:hypothetical protein
MGDVHHALVGGVGELGGGVEGDVVVELLVGVSMAVGVAGLKGTSSSSCS